MAGLKRGVRARGLLAVLLALGVAAVCVRLGFWQLQRLEQRRAFNATVRAAMAAAPVELDSAVAAQVAAAPEEWTFRRVRVTGAYLPDADVVLRGRAQQGRPGVHLVTPLRSAEAGVTVLVNRGWAPSPDAATVDPAPLAEPGVQRLEGVLQPIPTTPDAGEPATVGQGGQELLTYRRLDLPTLRARLPGPLLPAYIQQLPDAGVRQQPPHRVPLPELDEGPHFGYAFQWFSFAAIAVLAPLGVALFRRRR